MCHVSLNITYVLLYICPHTTAIYMSSYFYIRVSSYYYISVLILLYMCVVILLYICRHTTKNLSSYYYICVIILLYIVHTTVYPLFFYFFLLYMLLYMCIFGFTTYVPACYCPPPLRVTKMWLSREFKRHFIYIYIAPPLCALQRCGCEGSSRVSFFISREFARRSFFLSIDP